VYFTVRNVEQSALIMQPATAISILRLHHAQITIPKGAEEEARRFYCGLLGLHEIAKPESLQGRGGFWLALGDQQMHIGTEDGVERTATKAHLAYQVAGLSQWRSRLEGAGIGILDSIPIPGYDRFEFRDPFGNRVEFVEPVG
jgi:catechol 2,3-dioxygenase-like lactoylglutathione lyase family enzyme